MGLTPIRNRSRLGRRGSRYERGVLMSRSSRLLVAAGVLSLSGAWSNQAHAVGVAAGTNIDNTAQVTYSVGPVSATATSNTTSVTVAEILDAAVTLQTPSVPVLPGAVQQEMVYRLSNTGNGPE